MYERASFFLGYRMLFRSKASRRFTKHLIGSIIGIGLSLIPLITVIEVSGGMIEGITRRFIEIGSYHLQVKNYSPVDSEEKERVRKLLLSQAGVEHAHPVLFGEGLVYSASSKTGATIRALPADYYQRDKGVQRFLEIESGEFRLETPQDVLLSREIADTLDAEVGDRIRLLTARSIPGRAPILRPSLCTVRGIFSTGYYELDSLSIYISEDLGTTLFREAGSFVYGLKIKQPYEKAQKTAEDLMRILPEGWMIYTWYNLERPMLESFQTTRALLIFVMALIVLVAAVNISSSMIMLVLEKEPEIAMLKSMGVSPRVIRRAFVFTGFFIGFSAVLIGTSIGLSIAVHINEVIGGMDVLLHGLSSVYSKLMEPFGLEKDLQLAFFNRSYYLDTIPIKIKFAEIFFTVLGTLLLSTTAAYIPARRAGRVKPLEILRKH